MTVKELIIKLLEENMDAKVLVSIDRVHYNEHGRCEGYSFNIGSVNYEYGACMIKFKDYLGVLEGSKEVAREWIENTRYNRRGKKFLNCPVCRYGENGDIICEVSKVPNYCPNCGMRLILPVKKEGDKG